MSADSSGAGGTKRRPPNVVQVKWDGEQRFDTGRPGGPVARIDGTGKTGQSPVDAVLSGLAACTSIDVVEILAKRRTPVERLEVTVTGHRVETTPRRVEHVLLEYHVDGAGIDRTHAERAVDLSITKYCSVRDSLAADLLIEWTLVLNGDPGVLINVAGPPRAGAR